MANRRVSLRSIALGLLLSLGVATSGAQALAHSHAATPDGVDAELCAVCATAPVASFVSGIATLASAGPARLLKPAAPALRPAGPVRSGRAARAPPSFSI